MNIEPIAASQITGKIHAANVGSAAVMSSQITGHLYSPTAAFADAAMRAVVKALSPHTC